MRFFMYVMLSFLMISCTDSVSKKVVKETNWEDSTRREQSVIRQKEYYQISCRMMECLGLEGVECEHFNNVNQQNYWIINILTSEYSSHHLYKILAQIKNDTLFYTNIEYDFYGGCFSGPKLEGKDYDSLYSWTSNEYEGAKDYFLVYSVRCGFFIPSDHFKTFMNDKFWELKSVQEETLRRPFWEIIGINKDNKKYLHTIYAGSELASCVEVIIKECGLPFD